MHTGPMAGSSFCARGGVTSSARITFQLDDLRAHAKSATKSENTAKTNSENTANNENSAKTNSTKSSTN